MNQDPFSSPEFPVVIPDLGPTNKPLTFLMWLIDEGAYIIPGERIAEILVDSIVFHLEAPAEGHVKSLLVKPEAVVRSGDKVAMLTSDVELS